MQTSDTFGREIAKLRLDRLSDRTASHYKMDIKLPPLRLCRSGRARISSRSRKSPAAGRRNNAVRGNQPCPVGLIIHGDVAEQILEDGQADLTAAGREILYNPD